MRTIAALLVLASCSGGNGAVDPRPATPSATFRVLFIGNSLTYTNDLPGTVAALGGSAGPTITVASVANRALR